MRRQLCDALVARSRSVNDMIFLTGDVGFNTLEPLQEAMGERFINAGVAEQNMVGVAAALAAQELEVWIYSIAPFLYARSFEHIRNDICFHQLPVKLIGSGGGYGYGVLGPTHHAIDDYGALLTMPGMSVLVPAFDEDVEAVVTRAASSPGPTYLRIATGLACARLSAVAGIDLGRRPDRRRGWSYCRDVSGVLRGHARRAAADPVGRRRSAPRLQPDPREVSGESRELRKARRRGRACAARILRL